MRVFTNVVQTVFTKYQERYNDGMIGLSPGLDSIMVVMMAWVLAPIDVSLTWIRWYKDAEEARRNQIKNETKVF